MRSPPTLTASPTLRAPRRLSSVSFERLFQYNTWANGECAVAVGAGGAPALALRVLGHIVGAEHLWLARLRDTRPALAVWPALTVERCATECAALGTAWAAFIESAAPARLGDVVSYVNSKGEPWRSTVGDILTHVVLHSAYHRGQIASHVRAAGAEPAYTDFIHATRTGLVP
jgi:uncharacterized damage-inducible protein DinB